MAPSLRADRLARAWRLWAPIAAWAALCDWLQSGPSGLSWHFFALGGHILLTSQRFEVYALHPEFQVGPLALLAAAPLTRLDPVQARVVAQAAMGLAGLVCLMLIAGLVRGPQRDWRIRLVALVLMPAWGVLAVRWAHLDDVLALLFGLLAVRAVVADRALLAGLALAFAAGSKPWAIGFLPLVFVLTERRTLAATAAGIGIAAVWAPFLLADATTLRALQPRVVAADSAGIRAFGYRGVYMPSWDRPVQLLFAPVAALVAALGRAWPGILLVAIAVRLGLDPMDNAYYVGGAVLAAAVFDLLGTDWTVPWTTLVTALVWWQPFILDYKDRFSTTTGLDHWWFTHPSAISLLHLGWAVAVIALVYVKRPAPLPGTHTLAPPLVTRTAVPAAP